MTTPVLNQLAGRLYALSTAGGSGVPRYWAGYLCSADAGFGAQTTLQQAWADAGGVFLFLNACPAQPAQFCDALVVLLPQLSPRGWLRHGHCIQELGLPVGRRGVGIGDPQPAQPSAR
jgi:hypothetical protein